MKRTFKVPFLAPVHTTYTVGLFAFGAAMLLGCPVYSGSTGSGGSVNCDPNGYCCDPTTGYCPPPYYDGGTDGTTDCTTTGCQAGYQCTLTNGVAICLQTDAGSFDGGTGSDATTDSSSASEASPSDTGTSDASDAQSVPPFTGCTSDNACVADSGAGARCLNGQCVAAANECFDGTQCPIVGSAQESCVQGVCTPSCAGGASCPAGYACDTATDVCTVNPTPCGAADSGTCASGTTCVDQHCVPLCTNGADGAPTCSGVGLVCVDNGCIPNQEPVFVCTTDGQQDSCAGGSICLHHNCYIACSLADAGADAGNTCRTAGNFNVCKPVVTSSGTHDVCGTSTNLGSQCNPTAGQNCISPAICIDGYCR